MPYETAALMKHSLRGAKWQKGNLRRVLLAVELGGVDKVGQRSLGLLPLAGLETAVRVDPELLGLEEGQHLGETVLDLLLRGNTGRVDVVDTGTNVAGVGLVLEDLEELGVALAVLDGEDIGIEGGNGVEEVESLTPAQESLKESTAHARYFSRSVPARRGRPSRRAGSSTWMTKMPAASRSTTSSRRARASC
jgi:hypothetical protein